MSEVSKNRKRSRRESRSRSRERKRRDKDARKGHKKKRKHSSRRSSRRSHSPSRSRSRERDRRDRDYEGENRSSRRSKDSQSASSSGRRDSGKREEINRTKTAENDAAILELDNKSVAKSSSAEEKEKRRQRLKEWQAQREKVPTKILVKQSTNENATTAAAVASKVWALEDDNAEKKKLTKLPSTTDSNAVDEGDKSTGAKDLEDDVDPLESYMEGLEGAAAQKQFGGGIRPLHHGGPKATTITLEDINAMSANLTSMEKPDGGSLGSFLPAEPAMSVASADDNMVVEDDSSSNAYGGVTPGRMEESKEDREERELREHQEFMEAIRKRNKAGVGSSVVLPHEEETDQGPKPKEDLGRIYQGMDEDAIGEEAGNVEQRSTLEILLESQKKKEVKEVDHSTIDYIDFRKKFYIVPKEIKEMNDDELKELRKKLEIKVRGKGAPKPITKWIQCGFSQRMLLLINKHGFEKPFAIQQQALPAVMSGRDVIGIAKTGSGKTLAFLLPMFRHILDQPPLGETESGPIGLIIAPSRELAKQIYTETKKFSKGLNLRATAVYGGSAVSEQIANLKRGSDIVICTPGRMIDIMCMNSGKLMNLQRTTFVILDEADRLFDMGFGPQIGRILANIRPDRQTLLFSATFPRTVESLARKALTKPIEITVGRRSTASGDITQYVEVRDEDDKFMRLLQLLGTWYEKGNVLVFVNTQQACDNLFQDLMKAGYHSLSLHGGKDQMDRDYTIDDFKSKVRTLMVATSVAGRGLDVKDLVLVINYHCPNHLEDYVHRVGRTGRAGRKGTAYTFISPDEEEYAPDLVKALENAKQDVPPELLELNNKFKEKVSRGEARYHGSGFKGKGYTFDEDEKTDAQKMAALQRKQYEIEEGIIEAEVDEESEASKRAGTAVEESKSNGGVATVEKAAAVAAQLAGRKKGEKGKVSGVAKAQQIAAILDRQYRAKQRQEEQETGSAHFEIELEINEYPQQARWKATHKDTLDFVSESTGCAVIARGSHVPPGRKPNPGERKLYLTIEGNTMASVSGAKRELQRILDETTLQFGLGGDKYGKYSI